MLLTGCTSGRLAVVRGQNHIPMEDLPLACLALGTEGIGMGVHSITLQNIWTNPQHTFIVSKSFGKDPDYLTAVSGQTVFCLLTLHLEPGEYIIRSIEYTGPKNHSAGFTFRLREHYQFRVTEKAVHYVVR